MLDLTRKIKTEIEVSSLMATMLPLILRAFIDSGRCLNIGIPEMRLTLDVDEELLDMLLKKGSN